MDFRFTAREADDRELVEVHDVFSFKFVRPREFRGTRRNERPCSQTPPECIPGGTGGYDSPKPRIVPGVPGKQNAGVCRAQWFKRSWCPDSLGKRYAGELQCLTSRT